LSPHPSSSGRGPPVVVVVVSASSVASRRSSGGRRSDDNREGGGDYDNVFGERPPRAAVDGGRRRRRIARTDAAVDGDDRRRRDFAAGSSALPLLLVAIAASGVVFAAPSPCLAAAAAPSLPRPADLKTSLVSIVDGLSRSGPRGMAAYALGFTLWTMTVGATTPVEIAAGMAFPLRAAIPLSAMGKIGGAALQYAFAKYLFSEVARKKLDGNEWMGKIDASFRNRPFGVALIWRFSPLPEFVKNVGPALVPGLRTRYQLLATLTHGLPFTALWSCMGNEAAIVARGVSGSVFRLVRRSLHYIIERGWVMIWHFRFFRPSTLNATLRVSFLSLSPGKQTNCASAGSGERALETDGAGHHVGRPRHFSDPIRWVDQGIGRILREGE
jgi:uncharacterized membrane protein YdjX (TVP38/TMEM64 family)